MKKVFISQPMRDKTNEEILEVRERAINCSKEFLKDDVEIIDSFFKDAPHDAKPLWYLSKALELLSTADVAVFAYGWDDYRGCRIEHECCRAYNIPIILLNK